MSENSEEYTKLYEAFEPLEWIASRVIRISPVLTNPVERSVLAAQARAVADRFRLLADIFDNVDPETFLVNTRFPPEI